MRESDAGVREQGFVFEMPRGGLEVVEVVMVRVRGGYGDFGTKCARMFVSTIGMYIA
jgi:hypothetical protein